MKSYVDHRQESKNRVVAGEIPQKQEKGDSVFNFVDNRPQVFLQRKLQSLADNSPQVQTLSQVKERMKPAEPIWPHQAASRIINNDSKPERDTHTTGGCVSRVNFPKAAKQGQSLQLKTVSGTSLGVIQRAGDKMAFQSKDLSTQAEEIQQLSTAIEKIYKTHKSEKKKARNKLDQNFANKTVDLELQQSYLIKAIEMVFYEEQGPHMVHNFSQSSFDKEIDKRDRELVDSELPDIKKYGLLVQASTIAAQIYPMVQTDLQERSDQNKTINIKALNSILYRYSSSYGRHAIADPIVQGYEKDYLASGMSHAELVKEWVEEAKQKDYGLTADIVDDVAQVVVTKGEVKDATPIHIATVYFNDKRFVPEPKLNVVLNPGASQPETREVFKHRETGNEYVQDARNIFVRRYVSRALNKYDNPDEKSSGVQINADPRVKKGSADTWAQIAVQLPGMSEQERDEEIRKHQRAKEAQGGSPFVSFTTTEHPIFGSSAKLFESDRGVATVDLARISKSKIFDTHTGSAMKRIHEVDNPVPNMPYLEGDDEYERNSAARDAMRTRELVVSGDIPLEAITGVKDKSGDYVKSSGRFYRP